MTDHSLSFTDHEFTDHELLISQLPWLANGTLDKHEETLLRTHLKECATCRDEFASVSNMLKITNQSAEHITHTDIGARDSLARMKERIANESKRQETSPLYVIKSWLKQSLGNHGKPIVAFASVSILMLAVWLITHNSFSPDAPADYQVLSNQEQVNGIKFTVTFDDVLSREESSTLLTEISQQVELKTRFHNQNDQQLTFVATQDGSAPHTLPLSVSKMMELLKDRAEVVDVQLVP